MKQPELGQLIASTRSKRSITQEDLAESCDVSVRTIQRIENGSVNPQAFTLRAITETLEIGLDPKGKPENTFWIVVAHLSTIFLAIPVPLIVWAIGKNNDALSESHAKKALNFQITMTFTLLAWFGLVFLGGLVLKTGQASISSVFELGVFFVVTLLPPIILSFFITGYAIANSVRSINGREAHYPMTIQFFK